MTDKCITSYENCKEIVEKLQWDRLSPDSLNTTLFYRGHSKSSYQLIPSIARSQTPLFIIKAKEWLLEKICSKQKKYQIEETYALSRSQQIWYFWIQRQHCGGKTRLLDWSQCWKVALFFAVKDDFSTDGSLWIAKSKNSLIKNDNSKIFETNYRKQKELIFLNPPTYMQYPPLLGEQNRGRQCGFFFYFPITQINIPLNMQKIPEVYFEEYKIPANIKKSILQELEKERYTEEFLLSKSEK